MAILPGSNHTVYICSYPIHAAIIGGNLRLVKWFLSNRQCPLVRPTSQSPSEPEAAVSSSLQPLLTSKGRSPVQLALPHLDILHYFVKHLNLNLLHDLDVSDQKIVLVHFTQLLRKAPASMVLSSKLPSKKEEPKQPSSPQRGYEI